MTRRFFLLCVVGLGAVGATQLTSATAAPATFQAGEEAYIALHFSEARTAYQATAALAASPAKDRTAALCQLAVMAWRIDNRPTEAEHYFAEALAVGADQSATHVERARFYESTSRFENGLAAANAAVGAASSARERYDAALAFAVAVNARLEGVGIADQSAAQHEELERARTLARPFSAEPPMTLEMSEALLEVALRLDDGALALTAWRSYARETESGGPSRDAARLLAGALPQSTGAGVPESARDNIVEGLRLSQFFRLSALVAADRRSSHARARLDRPRVRETVAYAAFISDMTKVTDAYYRDVANKRGDVAAWKQQVISLGQKLWPELDFAAERPTYSQERFERDVRTRFGGYINLGETGGVPDLHYGHVVADDAREIDQYGHKATLRRLAIDLMVSNGYESWVWDGRQAHGGWSTAEFLVQVRPGYADGALGRWLQLIDPALRAAEDTQIDADTVADDAIAARQEIAFLPGLARRLQRQGQDALLAALRAQGTGSLELKRAFVIRLSQVVLDSNFFAHEGRHSLDRQFFGAKEPDQEELEFRAKLSEVAFSDEPRMSWDAILNPNIADATSPHGRANTRIVRGLIAWMTAHQSQIAGLDPARPLLPQFDRLTNDQMRDAMRSMDPWAPKT